MHLLRSVTHALFALACLCSASLCAQSPVKKPDYDVLLLVDGKPVDVKAGMPVAAQHITLSGQLTAESRLLYPQLEPTVTVNTAIISLARNTRRVAFATYTKGESAADLAQQAQVGDHYVIELLDVSVQTKDGTRQPLDIRKIQSIALR